MSGDTFDFFQGNRETLTGTLHDPAATPGDVLTVQADKSIAAAPGGGSTPVFANYMGAPVLINNAGSASLTWDTLLGGTELFDRTDPTEPRVLTPGSYWFALDVNVQAIMTVGGSYRIAFTGYDADFNQLVSFETDAPPAVAGGQAQAVALAVGCEFPEGGNFAFQVYNLDGVQNLNFVLAQAAIFKLG